MTIRKHLPVSVFTNDDNHNYEDDDEEAKSTTGNNCTDGCICI